MGFIIHPRLVIRKHQSRAHVQWALATTAVVISCLLLPGDAQGRGSLVGCRLWGPEESDTTERLPSPFSLSRIGEGNGSPLQYSCLETPMGGGAWCAAVHGVAKSGTRLSDFPLPFHFHALEKDMAAHSRVLAWRTAGTGEPGGLPSVGPHRVGHDWSDSAAAAAAVVVIITEKENFILKEKYLDPVFLYRMQPNIRFPGALISS